MTAYGMRKRDVSKGEETGCFGRMLWIVVGCDMYRVLVAIALESEANQLLELPVWGESSGFLVVSSAHNGRHALELLRHERYDLTILEIDLPLIDGLRLIRYIHTESLCPVVTVLSTSSNFQYVRECILYGAFDYLPKMPGAAMLSEMLGRASKRLQQNASNWMAGGGLSSREEEEIFGSILRHSEEYIMLFQQAANMLYHAQEGQSVAADMHVRRLYNNLVRRLFEHYPWLNLYFDRNSVSSVGAIHVAQEVHILELYVENLRFFVESLWQITPESTNENINRIVQYILAHPDEDLRLQTVAECTYINQSYLSTTFSARIGLNYSEFVTSVRMRRACFLLEHSAMMIGEIASQLHYRDAYYFSTLFKKQYGMTPSEFREKRRRRTDYAML